MERILVVKYVIHAKQDRSLQFSLIRQFKPRKLTHLHADKYYNVGITRHERHLTSRTSEGSMYALGTSLKKIDGREGVIISRCK